MCGIVGAVAKRDVVPILIEGLQRLEYRGYDSAGIAVLDGGIKRVRSVGRVAEMAGRAKSSKLHGLTGIGHNRWATHGGVTEPNAHPHISMGEIAVVHNGIIENHEEHRARLKKLGYVFESQTDTEVIAHLIHHHLKRHGDLFRATRETVSQLVGAYAIGVLSLKNPEMVTGARMGCPLLVGLGDGENFLASDVSAILSATRKVIYLEDGDVVELTRGGVKLVDRDDKPVQRKEYLSQASLTAMELGPYQHYMQKEIHEQPKALTDTLEAVMEDGFNPAIFGKGATQLLKGTDRILILAAGTSYYAGLTAKYWIEALAPRSSGTPRPCPSATCRRAPSRGPPSSCSIPGPEPRSASLPPRPSPPNWWPCSASLSPWRS
jgi:glucosamine--fructose-6-phosphate aminotransferase (isomerizing)